MTAEKKTTNLEFQTNVPNQSYPVQSQVSPKTSLVWIGSVLHFWCYW